MGGVFINYRGEDSQTAAALIDRKLTARFGGDNVFLDARSTWLQGDARAGFVVSCQPVGAMMLVMQDGHEQVGENASIAVTRAVEPGDC